MSKPLYTRKFPLGSSSAPRYSGTTPCRREPGIVDESSASDRKCQAPISIQWHGRYGGRSHRTARVRRRSTDACARNDVEFFFVFFYDCGLHTCESLAQSETRLVPAWSSTWRREWMGHVWMRPSGRSCGIEPEKARKFKMVSNGSKLMSLLGPTNYMNLMMSRLPYPARVEEQLIGGLLVEAPGRSADEIDRHHRGRGESDRPGSLRTRSQAGGGEREREVPIVVSKGRYDL